MFIPNQWYAVLESDEVKPGKPKAFKRLGQELVFWRDQSGRVTIMEDRCPHRQTKLSLGKVVDGCIECPFHGFRFDPAGACQLIPANGKNGPRPKIFQAKTYPTTEAHGFIWLWYGEPRETYPPVPFFDEVQNFSYATHRKDWATNYSRAIENQMDVAHLPFVHANTIGKGGQTLVNGPYTLVEDNAIYVWIDNQPDRGLTARKPGELVRPDEHWGLCFKFPNVWLLHVTSRLMMFVAFVPVDEENTRMYLRFYHDLAKPPVLRWLIAYAGTVSNGRILKQDERVVIPQRPKQGGLDSGDAYIPADRPIVAYYQQREKLLQAASKAEIEDGTLVKFSEPQLAG